MSTLGDIATRVAVKILNRSDATQEAVEFVRDAYLTICGTVPFPELETKSAELPTTADDPEIDLSTLDPPLAGILSIRYTETAGTRRRLIRRHVRQYDAQSAVVSSRSPYSYARFGKKIELNPPPSLSTDTLRVRYWFLPSIDSSDVANHQILTPSEWDELIMWEGLHRFYMFYEQFEKAAMLTSGIPLLRIAKTNKVKSFEMAIIPRLWNDLLQTIRDREHVDEDYGVNPVSRRYTWTRGR